MGGSARRQLLLVPQGEGASGDCDYKVSFREIVVDEEMASYDDDETNLVEDEYDDLDGFIVDGSEDGDDVAEELPEAEEEEVEEEEVFVEEEEEEPPAGLQEILSIREQLKAKLRKQHQSNGAGAGKTSCSPSMEAPARSRFGTFFGPSTPALAPRLIEAGSSSIMREIQNVPSRRDAAAPSASKAQTNASPHEQKPKVVNQVKRKVDTLRENRDYSNLFSDDADTPAPAKESPENKPAVSPKSSQVKVCGTKPMQCVANNNKVPTGQPARVSKDHGSIQGRVQNKVCSQVNKPLPLPNGRKTNPSVGNSNARRLSNDVKKAPGPQSSSNGQNLQRSMQSKRPQASPAVQKQQQQRPPQVQRQQNHALPSSQVRKVNSFVQSKQQPAQKGSAMSQDRRKLLGQKQLAPSSRPKASPTSAAYRDHPKKTGVVKRKINEEEDYRTIIRGLFKYNPEKYAGRDRDDPNMEAGYASIQMEERRSAKLARKEDDEQLQMIQEEERRERANKKKKQRVQS
ncbi:unnamed protein product [Alopecurus aequalis]